MRARLFSKLSYILVAAAALTALVLALVAIIELQEERSIEVRNAGAECSISQSAGGNARAENWCGRGSAGGGGSLKQVVARARGNARVVVSSGHPARPLPLKPFPMGGGTWTQGAAESDQFIGEATWNGCEEARIDLWVNGQEVGSATVRDFSERRPRRATFQFEQSYGSGGAVLFEPGQSRRRRLTAKVATECSEAVVFHSLKVNVLGFR